MLNLKDNKKEIIIILGAFLAILFVVFVINPIIGIISAGLILLVLLFTYYQNFGLYLLAFLIPVINWYIPFEKFNLHYFGFIKEFAIPLVDLIGLILLAGFLARQIYYLFCAKGKLKEVELPAGGAFLIFFSMALISALNAHSWFGSFWYSVRWILVFYVVYIILPVNIIKDKKILRNVIISFVLSGLTVSLMGIASLFQQDWHNDFVRFRPIGISGIYPIGWNQKQISEILVSAAVLAMGLRYWFYKGALKKVVYGLYVLFIIVLLGSFSRAAWLIVFLQFIFFLVYYRREYFSNLKKTLVAAAVFIMLAAPFSYYMTALQESAIGLSSNEHRLLLNDITLKGFAAHPLIGSGSGEFFHLEEESIRYQATGAGLMDAHGIWQKIGAETGILGLAAFVFFVASLIYYVYKKFKETVSIRGRSLIIYLALAGASIFMFEFFDTSFYRGKLWFIVGLMLAGARVLSEKSGKNQG